MSTAVEVVPIHVAMARVMADVRALAKGDKNTHFNFMFRGIDSVLNAIGPALRSHGVVVLPKVLDCQYRDVRTAKDKPAREVTVRVEYTFVGPAGDSLSVITAGESMDEADKGTAKAMSVAMRIALLQAFALPTDEPDPDASDVQRGSEYEPDLDGLRAAILDETNVDQLRGMRTLMVPARLAAMKVMAADDQTETTLLRLLTTRGTALAEQAKAAAQAKEVAGPDDASNQPAA